MLERGMTDSHLVRDVTHSSPITCCMFQLSPQQTLVKCPRFRLKFHNSFSLYSFFHAQVKKFPRMKIRHGRMIVSAVRYCFYIFGWNRYGFGISKAEKCTRLIRILNLSSVNSPRCKQTISCKGWLRKVFLFIYLFTC